MMVTSYVELTVPAQERHLKVARAAAEWLTTDKSSVTVEVPVDAPKMIVTTFPIARARQNDVADRIMRAFAKDMEDYSTQSVGFPKSEAEQRRDKRKLERAKERRRERRAAREAEARENRVGANIPYGLDDASQQIEQLIRPMGFNKAQRVQFFVLLQIALMGRAFSLHGCDSLAQREANRIYGLVHEFALPKDLTEGDEGFYRGRVYELVRFAEFHLSVAQDCFDQIYPERSVATDAVSAVRNFLALMLNACDGDGLEDIYRDRNAAI